MLIYTLREYNVYQVLLNRKNKKKNRKQLNEVKDGLIYEFCNRILTKY